MDLYTNSRELANKYDCYGRFDANNPRCVGAVTASGTRRSPCEMRQGCTDLKATHLADSVRRETSIVVRAEDLNRRQGAPPAPPPQRASPPGSVSPYALPGQPVGREPAPQPGRAPARAAGHTPEGAMSPVTYDAVAPHVGSRLPAKEATHHRKRTRFAAEVTRAGLVGAFQQAASFIANTPFLNDPSDRDPDGS